MSSDSDVGQVGIEVGEVRSTVYFIACVTFYCLNDILVSILVNCEVGQVM